MKKFLDKAGKFLLGLFGVIISVFGIFAYFQKSGSEVIKLDNDLADEESAIDDKIEEASKPVEIDDLTDTEIQDYWSDNE